jgi:hypothetical protein
MSEMYPESHQELLLKDILNYDNPNKEKYQVIIDNLERINSLKEESPPTDRYSDLWFDLDRGLDETGKDREFFKDKLSGNVLIDLGGGRVPAMRHFAKNYGAKAFINVERFLPDRFPVDPTVDLTDALRTEKEKDMDMLVVKADMLDFVSKLPDNFANFTINGIDSVIIEDQNYHHALAQELARATRPGGIIFGMCSDALWELEDKMHKAKLNFRNTDRETKIFEKL